MVAPIIVQRIASNDYCTWREFSCEVELKLGGTMIQSSFTHDE